ncbi:LETM1-like protein [Lutibacter oceani]|uniref:LETM1-like protein n=1 Tax=Lutibacter oceani TaxID=1853311 RepID=A0A3D9RIE5_9FLAO|nr:LETM1 domain-containing protein [Lutibacter oceani]REE78868.1 LETM1-like protein [Lutibacter oceani]
MNNQKKSTKLDLTVFERNGKIEFVHIIRRNKFKATKALNGFLIGLKNEASGSKETSRIIVKFISNQKISKEEEKHLKTQVYDIFKILGIGVPFMLIPGSTLLIPFIIKVAEKKGIDLIPSNFKKNKELKNSKMN